MVNPYGIIYNPLSIGNALSHGLSKALPDSDMIVQHEGLYHSLMHHGRFSERSQSDLERGMLSELTSFHTRLQGVDVLLVTFGSAHVYRYLENDQVVANCHKIPGDRFRKELSTIDSIVDHWRALLKNLLQLRPQLNVVFSVSPVRYMRDGVVENQRSKSTLILAISQLTEIFESCHYFPAYELMLDDLRDYRFYGNDLLHPSEEAVDYIWERVSESFFDSDARTMCHEVAQLHRSLMHRPIHPNTTAHQKFIAGVSQRIEQLKVKYLEKDFSKEQRLVDQQIQESSR